MSVAYQGRTAGSVRSRLMVLSYVHVCSHEKSPLQLSHPMYSFDLALHFRPKHPVAQSLANPRARLYIPHYPTQPIASVMPRICTISYLCFPFPTTDPRVPLPLRSANACLESVRAIYIFSRIARVLGFCDRCGDDIYVSMYLFALSHVVSKDLYIISLSHVIPSPST